MRVRTAQTSAGGYGSAPTSVGVGVPDDPYPSAARKSTWACIGMHLFVGRIPHNAVCRKRIIVSAYTFS